jgi:sec-independent protein translocase protein TatA
MPNLGTTEIIIIALVIVLLFGAKKIPDLMRGLGSGVREFKDAASGKGDDSSDKRPTNGDGAN